MKKETTVVNEFFPDVAAHIDPKREDTRMAVATLLQMSKLREEKLMQNQQIPRYFYDFREFMAWASEIIIKITLPDLVTNITGTEILIARDKELKSELNVRQDSFQRFEIAGKELLEAGQFNSPKMFYKISMLYFLWNKMQECCSLREEMNNRHIDFLQFSGETDAMEGWMADSANC